MVANSDKAEEILKLLGPNPKVEDLVAYTQETIGLDQLPNIADSNTKTEYMVTLHSYDDQDNFYDEMESLGSRGYAPSRKVNCLSREPTCRSTKYALTPNEAIQLLNDPRVQAVELSEEVRGIRARPLNYEFSNGWDKSGTNASNMKNWALLRCWLRAQIPGWGSNGTANQTAEITTTSAGTNVDCVVFDGNILPDHPEYARNADGSGGSRVIQFNWWSLNPQVTGQPAGTYNYSAGSAGNNGHGMHVAGIMAGNSCGWARASNIYNISPYGEQTNGSSTPNLLQLVNYIRYWHNNIKTVNPATGRKNPTVVNMSFGNFGNYFPRVPNGALVIDGIFYGPTSTFVGYPASPPAGQTAQQNTYNGNWAPQQFYNGGVQLFKDYMDLYGIILYFYTLQNAAGEAAIMDGVNEGIIWAAAAGNQYNEAGFLNNNLRYNSYIRNGVANPLFHNRMPAPANASTGTAGTAGYKSISNIGNIGSETNEQLSITSSAGSKVTMWAPGENIMSSYNSAGVPDPRNPAYFIAKLTGTSMASPQVSGILACLAEQYPNKNQAELESYLVRFCQQGIIPDLGIPLPPGPVSYYGLREAPNYFLNYYIDRPINGNTWPQKRSWLRPASGVTYPRTLGQYRNIQF
jgi:hypothetical protein